MTKNEKIWASLLESNSINDPSHLQGLLAIKSSYEPSVFFNNVGVLYEKMGDLSKANFYYLKSVGENFFNYQVWRNFLEVNQGTNFIPENIINILLYLIQSSFFINCYTLLLVATTILIFDRYLKKRITRIKMIGLMISVLSTIFILSFVIRSDNFFYSQKNTKNFYGPSVIFPIEYGGEGERVLLKLTSSGSFTKVFDWGSLKSIYWIRNNQILNL